MDIRRFWMGLPCTCLDDRSVWQLAIQSQRDRLILETNATKDTEVGSNIDVFMPYLHTTGPIKRD